MSELDKLVLEPVEHPNQIFAGRSKESFAHARGIKRDYGGLREVLDWCKSEMAQDWRWQMVEMSTSAQPGMYIFYFDSERDCLAFVLKWC